MTRAFRSGTAAKIIGVTLFVSGVILAVVWNLINYSGMDTRRLGFFIPLSLYLPFLLIPGGAFLFWRGRQYGAKADAERIVTDPNPDVLYLRAFRSDPSTKGYVFFTWVRLGWGLATEEEQLADVLRPFGDLVAIGQPGEGLPKPGAARIYASDEEWKEIVKGQMQAARLVIIRAGAGENLLWELKQAVETLNPQKVLILVLNMKADWKPSVLQLPRLPTFRRSVFKPYRQLFKLALRPVFERFGLEWQPQPVVFWVNVIYWLFYYSVFIFATFFTIRRLIKFATQR